MYTVDDLVANVKRRASIPNSNSLLSDEDIMLLAQDELDLTVTPLVMSVNEEFFVTSEDLDIQTGVSTYAIPGEAVGMRLRGVSVVNNPGEYETVWNLSRITLEQLGSYTWNTGGFYLEGNNVKLFPTPNQTGTLRLYFYKTPLTLTQNINAGQVTVIDGNILTLANMPEDWTTGTDLSVVQGYPPFNTIFENTDAVLVTGNDVTLSSVSGITVGDWVCPRGFSTIPQLPREAIPLLAQATVVKCLEAIGDNDGMKRAEAKLEQVTGQLIKLLTPRSDANPKKFVNRRGIFSGYGNINAWKWW